MRSAGVTGLLINRDLMVGTRAVCDNVMKPVDLACAIERLHVFMNEIQDLIEPSRGIKGVAAEWVDEGSADPVALGVPFILRRDGTANAVEASVQRPIAIKRANET